MKLDKDRVVTALDEVGERLIRPRGGADTILVAVGDRHGVRVERAYGTGRVDVPVHQQAVGDVIGAVAVMQLHEAQRMPLTAPLGAWRSIGATMPPGIATLTVADLLTWPREMSSALMMWLVEQETRGGFDAYTRASIFAPAGATQTQMSPTMGAWTTAGDFARLLHALLRDGDGAQGRVLGPATVQAMVEPVQGAPGRGLGLTLGGEGDGRWFGTTGRCQCGWVATGRSYPEADVTVAVLHLGGSVHVADDVIGVVRRAMAETARAVVAGTV